MAASKKPTGNKTNKKPASSGVFDVARPSSGALTPSGTSRPVIIKHQLMPDPMVNDEPKADLPSAPPLKPAKKVIITPLHDTVEPDAATEEAVTVKVEAKAPEEPVEAIKITETIVDETAKPDPKPADVTPAAATTEPEQTPKPAAEPEPKFSPETRIADVAAEPDVTAIPADNKSRQAETEAARAKAAKLQKMIDEEEFFLPIQTLEERRSRRVAIFGLKIIIILAVAWYNVALDANLLNNTYNLPHTHFFSVKS